jgi:3-oxoacyl-[acyl-carrier protein] reductase
MAASLGGRAAIVTGASRGIGLAIAERLAADGMRVLLVARSAGAIAEAAARLPGAAAHAADLREPGTAAAAVEQAVLRFGGLDLVVNCAGATQRGDFQTLSDAAWADGYALKLHGAVRVTRAAWPHLKARGGSVVMIAGIGGKQASAAATVSGVACGHCLNPQSSMLMAFRPVLPPPAMR